MDNSDCVVDRDSNISKKEFIDKNLVESEVKKEFYYSETAGIDLSPTVGENGKNNDKAEIQTKTFKEEILFEEFDDDHMKVNTEFDDFDTAKCDLPQIMEEIKNSHDIEEIQTKNFKEEFVAFEESFETILMAAFAVRAGML